MIMAPYRYSLNSNSTRKDLRSWVLTSYPLSSERESKLKETEIDLQIMPLILFYSETAIPILYPDVICCGHVHCDTFSSKQQS